MTPQIPAEEAEMTIASDSTEHPHDLTIRPLDHADREEIRRLAQRDSAPMPSMPMLGAESGGRLVAAMALSAAGEADVIADPFAASAGAVELLRLRASQLRYGGGSSAPRSPISPRALLARLRPGPGHTRAAVGASPPGADGRLLRL